MTEIIRCEHEDGEYSVSSAAEEINRLTINNVDCPHWVPPEVDPEEWDALKEKNQKK